MENVPLYEKLVRGLRPVERRIAQRQRLAALEYKWMRSEMDLAEREPSVSLARVHLFLARKHQEGIADMTFRMRAELLELLASNGSD